MNQHTSALPPDFTVKTRFGGLNRYKTMLGLGSTSINGLILICLLSLAARFAVGTAAAAQSAAVESKSPSLMDREREMALALSACPAAVASKAAVYVLGASGYIKVRESQNGFVAIVQHSLPTSQEPQCIDAEGARTFVPRILKVAELRAQGRDSDEIKRFVADAVAKGILQPPTRPGLTYMLSSENMVPDDKGVVAHFPPHLMFYAPYLTNADIGSDGKPGAPAFIASEGTPYALIIVPVGAHTGPPHASTNDSPQ
jgi:hypothetical protein